MSLTLDELRSKRATILGQMQQIDHLRRGTLSQQFFKKRQNGEVVEFGPTLSSSVSSRVRSAPSGFRPPRPEKSNNRSKTIAASNSWLRSTFP